MDLQRSDRTQLNVSCRQNEKFSLIMDYKKVINLLNETMGLGAGEREIFIHNPTVCFYFLKHWMKWNSSDRIIQFRNIRIRAQTGTNVEPRAGEKREYSLKLLSWLYFIKFWSQIWILFLFCVSQLIFSGLTRNNTEKCNVRSKTASFRNNYNIIWSKFNVLGFFLIGLYVTTLVEIVIIFI